ncbi:MAG: c-type cytochrome [Acidobacteriota bacterium]
MNKNKQLLLVSSVGVLALLIIAAVQENVFRDWRRVQSQARTDEGPINVQLRQVVNPGLQTSDRCISCHVSMGPGDQGVVGHEVLVTHKPVVHDPAEYGCTICHGGQGQATDKRDAHGEVSFWPEPMIPASFSYAGCGTCHAPLQVPARARLGRARAIFERLDCSACHRVDGRGGTIRPSGGGMEGPDLSRVGITGYDPDWYGKHMAKFNQATSGPWRDSFGPIGEADQQQLAVYLATLASMPKLVEAKSAFHSSGCLGCHKVSGVGGDEGPDLSRAGVKDPGQLNFAAISGKESLANWLGEHFRSPVAVVAGSQMPAPSLQERDIELLTLYTLSLRRHDLSGDYLPKDRIQATRFGQREFAPDGETVFGAFCAGCHGADGLGRRAPGIPAFPSIANPDFQVLVSDRFLKETIRLGRPGRRMPAWGEKEGGLRPEEIDRVVEYVRRLSGVVPQADTRPDRWVVADPAAGKRLFESACSGCHGQKGEGGEGPALNNKTLLATATDAYLVETIGRGRRGTAMEGFLQPSAARRTLARPEIESIVAFIRSWQGGKS